MRGNGIGTVGAPEDVGTQLFARDASNALHLKDTLGGHALPLRYGSGRNPQFCG